MSVPVWTDRQADRQTKRAAVNESETCLDGQSQQLLVVAALKRSSWSLRRMFATRAVASTNRCACDCHTHNTCTSPLQQGVALTGRNRTGPPSSVGRPTAHAPGGRPARPPAALQTTPTDDDRQSLVPAPDPRSGCNSLFIFPCPTTRQPEQIRNEEIASLSLYVYPTTAAIFACWIIPVHFLAMYLAINHGGKRGTSPPKFGVEWSDFVMFQNFKHQTACIITQ